MFRDRHFSCLSSVSTSRVAISPPATGRLPPEIIIKLAKDVIYCSGFMVGLRGRLDFQSLRAVNREWRDTLLSTPEFWRSLSINLGGWSSKTDFFRQVISWFERDGEGSSLSLEIILSDNPSHPLDAADIHRLLSWPTLNFSCIKLNSGGKLTLISNHRALEEILSPAPSLANLEMLQLVLCRRRIDLPELPTLRLSGAFPALKRLEISLTRNIPLILHPTLSELHLERVQCSRDQLFTALHGLPSLSKLSIKSCEIPKPRSASPPPVYSHPNVCTVHLSQSFPDGLLHTFACPSLRTLILDVYHRLGSRSKAKVHDDTVKLVLAGYDLRRFIENSTPSSLELHFAGNPPREFVQEALITIPLVRRIHVKKLRQLLPDDGDTSPFASTFDEIRSEEKELGRQQFSEWKDKISHLWLNQATDDIKFVFEG